MEVKNMYDGTVLGQALWSAINEHTPNHAEIIEVLINGGVYVWPNTLEWWEKQDVPSANACVTAVTKRSSIEEARRRVESLLYTFCITSPSTFLP